MFSFLRSVICLMLLTSACLAQTRKPDIIVKRDNTKIESLVKEIDETTIRYQKVSNPTGPVYTIKKEEVVTILYANGEVENFIPPAPVPLPPVTTAAATPATASQKTTKPRSTKSDAPVPVETGSKQAVFLGGYSNSTNEQLLKDMEKYRRKSSRGKVWGTIMGTGGVALLVTGLLKTIGAESEAKSYLKKLDSYRDVANLNSNRFSSSVISAANAAVGPISGQLTQIERAYTREEISRDEFEFYRLEHLEKARDLVAPIIADEYRKKGLTTTLVGVGVAGLATAIYLRGASAGWKYKLLKQETHSKGLSMQILPDWQPMQRTAGVRLIGQF